MAKCADERREKDVKRFSVPVEQELKISVPVDHGVIQVPKERDDLDFRVPGKKCK